MTNWSGPSEALRQSIRELVNAAVTNGAEQKEVYSYLLARWSRLWWAEHTSNTWKKNEHGAWVTTPGEGWEVPSDRMVLEKTLAYLHDCYYDEPEEHWRKSAMYQRIYRAIKKMKNRQPT